MNTKGQDGKKRVAHVSSSSTKTKENARKVQYDDYLATIMDKMDSNDKQIVSYEQLNDYRKSKSKPVLPDLESDQTIESSGSFKLKKKPCPLMAKCQKNLNYIKHNRRVPKPRAHLGPTETNSSKLFSVSKKNVEAQIKPKKVESQELSRSLALHNSAKKIESSVAKKTNEEWNDKILKSHEGTEIKKRTAGKRESEAQFSVESSNVKHDSSEESDNFESFIKQQVKSHCKKTSQRNSKRKKVQRRKSFKRIKKKGTSETDSSDESSKTAVDVSVGNNKFKKSKSRRSVDGDNSLQFGFDNSCDDSSENNEANELVSRIPQNKIVKQSIDMLSNDSASNNFSAQMPISNMELNQSENSLKLDETSFSKQERSETKFAPKKNQVDGYESEDCVILEDSPPDFNIMISAVKSVAMLPTTDEEESGEAILESNSLKSMSNSPPNLNQLTRDESDDCLILEESMPDSANCKLNDKASINSLENCPSEDTKQSVIPPMKVSHDVWDVLRGIDFKKIKAIPEQSPSQHSLISCESVPISVTEGYIKSEKLSNEFGLDPIQSSEVLQDKICPTYQESYINSSVTCKDHGKVELINLSDNEDGGQIGIVESTNQNLDFISLYNAPTDATVGSTSLLAQTLSIPSKYADSELKTGDVSSSSVKDDSDFNIHNSLVPYELSDNEFPLKQEVNNVNMSKMKKETWSTSDELDISCASSLTTLSSTPGSNVLELLNLYQKEYERYNEIQNTGRNLSDGLSLLLNKQVVKLKHIKSSIKNIVKHDHCFKKESKSVKPEIKPIECNAIVKKEQDCEKKTKLSPSLPDCEHPELSINTESVLQGIQEVGNSLPPESSLRAEKVKEQLSNIKCAQCRRTASAACQGCFKVFYCSTECGMSDWEKGHSVSCGT